MIYHGTLKLSIVIYHGTQDQSLYVEFPATVYSFMQKSTFYGTWLLHSRNTCFGSDFSTKKRKKMSLKNRFFLFSVKVFRICCSLQRTHHFPTIKACTVLAQNEIDIFFLERSVFR